MATEPQLQAFPTRISEWEDIPERDWMKVSQIKTPALMYGMQEIKRITGDGLACRADKLALHVHRLCMADPGRDVAKTMSVNPLVGVWEIDLGYIPTDWHTMGVMNVSHVLKRLEREVGSIANVSYLSTSSRPSNACIPPMLYNLTVEDASTLYNQPRGSGKRGLQVGWSIQWRSPTGGCVFQGFQRQDVAVGNAISSSVYTTFTPCNVKASGALFSTMQRATLRVSCSRYDSEMPILWFQSTYTLSHWEHRAWVQGMILYIASDNVREGRPDAWAIHTVCDYLNETEEHDLGWCMRNVWGGKDLWSPTDIGAGRWQVKVRNKSGKTFYVVVWQERRDPSGRGVIHFATSSSPVVTDAMDPDPRSLECVEPYSKTTFHVWCDGASHDDFMFRAWGVVEKHLGDGEVATGCNEGLASMGPRSFWVAGALYMAWMEPSAHEV